ncbi:MAG: family 10 glycosylhydrolase [Chitinophagaceae bacterium]|nr:family 10 glycosylhydrolase [Chitinophagaceae bacterium]
MKLQNSFIKTAIVFFFTFFLNLPAWAQNTQQDFKVPREFRAAWVATVANINWPSKPGLSTEQQKKEVIDLLDFLKEHNYNAVVFQVRPQADALYQSDLEPWSYYLTGEQGKAPDPFYDPLTFWVEAAHDRGLELHVWLNPYRAHHIVGGPVSEHSLVKKMPETVLHLKEGYWWFDPSLKEVQDHGVAVVMDIVKRYDIDGVHFDDYFYPYPSYNLNEDFPDTTSWKQYVASGGTMSRGDWRRNSVNIFIERLYKEIKKEKPHVKFGLSPFGIWRPGYPESIGGFDQYDQLYADARLWLREGWIDYFSPQLYWPINRLQQSFPVLLGWWSEQNFKKRHLWPGISIGRDTSRFMVNETLNQIMITRGMQPQSSGVIHWSISSVIRNPNMAKMLIDGPYARKALVPASPWLSTQLPATPEVTTQQPDDSVSVQWTHKNEKEVFHWVVYATYGPQTVYYILDREERKMNLAPHDGKNKLSAVSVTAVDKFSNESVRNTVDPQTLAIIPRSGWNAAEARPYKSQVPKQITVHHEGGRVLLKTDDAALRLKNVQKWCMGPDRNWVDVPYHFLIAPDGTVYEGRNPLTAGETATEYDPTGHLLISFLGNYERQEPDAALMEILARLIAKLCKQYNISPETIATHRDHSVMTTCPGKYLYPYFQDGSVKKRVKEIMKKKDEM